MPKAPAKRLVVADTTCRSTAGAWRPRRSSASPLSTRSALRCGLRISAPGKGRSPIGHCAWTVSARVRPVRQPRCERRSPRIAAPERPFTGARPFSARTQPARTQPVDARPSRARTWAPSQLRPRGRLHHSPLWSLWLRHFGQHKIGPRHLRCAKMRGADPWSICLHQRRFALPMNRNS